MNITDAEDASAFPTPSMANSHGISKLELFSLYIFTGLISKNGVDKDDALMAVSSARVLMKAIEGEL